MNKGNKAGLGITMLVLGLIVGGAIAYPIGHSKSTNNKSSSSMSMSSTAATDGVTVGGAKMVRTKDIVDNAVAANNVTTVVTAVKAAGLVDTLKSEGPFTVFAPDNDAFAKLPGGTVSTLLQPANKQQLTDILTYHVVPGTYTTAALRVMAEKGQTLTSVQGGVLTPVIENNELKIQDAKGDKVAIVTPDVISSNGVTHVIDSVLMQ